MDESSDELSIVVNDDDESAENNGEIDERIKAIQAKGETSEYGGIEETVIDFKETIFENEDLKVTLDYMTFNIDHILGGESYGLVFLVDNHREEEMIVMTYDATIDGIELRDTGEVDGFLPSSSVFKTTDYEHIFSLKPIDDVLPDFTDNITFTLEIQNRNKGYETEVEEEIIIDL